MPATVDTLTLAYAIDQLRREEDPTGETTAAMSRDTAAAFDMHDAVHVLFGCGTSLEDEIAAHVWMTFGTTARIADMHRAVANQEHRKVLQGLGHGTVVRTWVRMVPRIVGIVVRARRMTGRTSFERLDELKGRGGGGDSAGVWDSAGLGDDCDNRRMRIRHFELTSV